MNAWKILDFLVVLFWDKNFMLPCIFVCSLHESQRRLWKLRRSWKLWKLRELWKFCEWWKLWKVRKSRKLFWTKLEARHKLWTIFGHQVDVYTFFAIFVIRRVAFAKFSTSAEQIIDDCIETFERLYLIFGLGVGVREIWICYARLKFMKCLKSDFSFDFPRIKYRVKLGPGFFSNSVFFRFLNRIRNGCLALKLSKSIDSGRS